jgi:hypothetical protein
MPRARRLDELGLNGIALDDEAVAAAVGIPTPCALRLLSLGGNDMRPGGLERILDAPWVAGLVELSLRQCGGGDDPSRGA